METDNTAKKIFRSKPEYFLGREKTQAKIKGYSNVMKQHHESDHRAVVTRLRRGSTQKLRRYRIRRHRFPVKLPKYVPQTSKKTLF